MKIIVSNKADKPIYEQIFDQISSQIVNGKLEANECLPSIRAIANELSISVITVKNAWEMLMQKGLIYSMGGKGCYVAELNNKGLSEKKNSILLDRLKKDIEFYKGMHITKEELKKLIDENF